MLLPQIRPVTHSIGFLLLQPILISGWQQEQQQNIHSHVPSCQTDFAADAQKTNSKVVLFLWPDISDSISGILWFNAFPCRPQDAPYVPDAGLQEKRHSPSKKSTLLY
jgi:hypothetical protein